MGSFARIPYTALAMVALAPGCSEEAGQLPWFYRFDPPEQSEQAARIRFQVIEGGCDGDRIVYEATAQAGADGPAPSTLRAGTYGLSARAYDNDCAPVAFECAELTFPTSMDFVTIVLKPTTGPAECAEGRCQEGLCMIVDAGAADSAIPADGGLDEGGAPDGSCSNADTVLVESTHTVGDCSGTVVPIEGGACLCRFGGPSCPDGWSLYQSYRTTSSRTCGSADDVYICDAPARCTAAGAGFSNHMPERCAYARLNVHNNCETLTCTASTTEVGCH